MASAPGAVLVLVCPTCAKKYRGNPEKPDGRYQCPDDQSTLTKFTPTQAATAPPPPPDFSVGNSSQQATSDTHRDFASTIRMEPVTGPGYTAGRDPLLASAHDDVAPDDTARRAADAVHDAAVKMESAGIDHQTVFVGNEPVVTGIATPPPTPAPDGATVLAGSRTYSAHEV